MGGKLVGGGRFEKTCGRGRIQENTSELVGGGESKVTRTIAEWAWQYDQQAWQEIGSSPPKSLGLEPFTGFAGVRRCYDQGQLW